MQNNENALEQLDVKNILADTPLYKVVETTNGELMVITKDEGPLSAFANIQTTQILHNRIEQLAKIGSITGIEHRVLNDALVVYRTALIRSLANG